MPEMYCLESVVHGPHTCNEYGEKLPVDIKEDDANDPRTVAV